jgi:phosphoglycolate phosphatase-like HAD superfamily hydrolase
MRNDTLLFLDFDGVLCDSLPETLVSSWSAYHQFVSREMPRSMPVDFRKRFCELRPFIRSGEDYLILQDIIFRGITVKNQIDFDRVTAQAGKTQMTIYKEAFYKARQELLDSDPGFWLALNPLFPPLKKTLKQYRRNERIYILSTKRENFILEILKGNGIELKETNIIDSGAASKISIIGKILDRGAGGRAIFIDDQIDHLLNSQDNRITTYLAAWGYVRMEWLGEDGKITVLSIENASKLIKEIVSKE